MYLSNQIYIKIVVDGKLICTKNGGEESTTLPVKNMVTLPLEQVLLMITRKVFMHQKMLRLKKTLREPAMEPSLLALIE